ncbi:hypothetical protein ACJX0J_040919 [Zea mays]
MGMHGALIQDSVRGGKQHKAKIVLRTTLLYQYVTLEVYYIIRVSKKHHYERSDKILVEDKNSNRRSNYATKWMVGYTTHGYLCGYIYVMYPIKTIGHIFIIVSYFSKKN